MQKKVRWIKDLCRFLPLNNQLVLLRIIYYRQARKFIAPLATVKICILTIYPIQLKITIPVNKLSIKSYKLSAINIAEQANNNNVIDIKYNVLTVGLT